jgi:hypothetical protein
MFKNSGAFWNWLVTSSQDPTQVALTVKGWVSAIVPVALIAIHNPNLSSLPNQVYSVVVAFFGVVTAAVTLYGLAKKIFIPSPAFTAAVASASAPKSQQ